MNLKRIQQLLFVALLVFPALTLSVKKSNSVTFYALMLAGLFVIFICREQERKSFRDVLFQWWPLHLSMVAMTLAVVPNQLVTGEFSFNAYDVPLRIAGFAVIFYLFLHLRARELKLVQWGLIAGVLINFVVIFLATHGGEVRPTKVNFLGVIPFSNHAMLLAFIALLSIRWQGNNQRWLTVMKVATIVLGLGITFLSQSRGGWLALLMYLIIAGIVFLKHNWKVTTVVLASLLLAVMATVFVSKNIQARLESVKTDVTSYANNSNVDTSIGLRFQFWQSALVIIKEHPLVGIGSDRYRDVMSDLAARKIVTPVAATYPHCHNEILFQTVRYGLPGLVSILAALLVPLFFFLKDVCHGDKEARATAIMGVTFCLAILTFGLTDVVLIWRETTTFYGFFIAVLFAHLIQRKREYDSGRNEQDIPLRSMTQ